MIDMNFPQYPAIHTPPLRRFKDPAHVEAEDTLTGLRELIDTLREQIVELLAQRALCVRDAASFKRDAYQLEASARRA